MNMNSLTNKNRSAFTPVFKSVELCIGGGGACLGIHQAGFTTLLGIDMDKWAIETCKRNFPEMKTILSKMEDVSTDEILKITGLKTGELNHLHCSWPCPEYSIANTKCSTNPPENINRNFYHFINKIKGLQPEVWTGENVEGILLGKKKLKFNDILKAINSLGNYDFKYKVLNAAFYGVPQSRRRLIIIGKRQDVAPNVKIQFPKPNYSIDRLRLQNVLPTINLFTQGQFKKETLLSNNFMCTLLARNSIKVYANGTWRKLTIEEAMLLMGFPNSFLLPCPSKTTNMRLLGNAVPPPMMMAVMTTIKETIFKDNYL